MAKTIAVVTQIGGVGKTATVLNLGHALARRRQKVLLVDLDPQAHLTRRVKAVVAADWYRFNPGM